MTAQPSTHSSRIVGQDVRRLKENPNQYRVLGWERGWVPRISHHGTMREQKLVKIAHPSSADRKRLLLIPRVRLTQCTDVDVGRGQAIMAIFDRPDRYFM